MRSCGVDNLARNGFCTLLPPNTLLPTETLMITTRILSHPRLNISIAFLTFLSVAHIDINAQTLFEFSGRSDQRPQYGFDAPGAFNAPDGNGSFVYRQVSADSDPHPDSGIYDVVIENFQLDFAGDQLLIPEVPAVVTIVDNSGCDCFTVDIDSVGTIAGQSFDHLSISLQNEFGPDAFTMFNDDSLPLDGLNLPLDSSTQLLIYNGNDLAIFEINQESIKLTLVPEPTSYCLFLLAVIGLSATRTSHLPRPVG